MKAGLGEEEQELPDGNKTSYKSLVGHYGHVLSTDKGKEEFAAAWKLLKIFLGKDATDLLDMVRIAYCKILRNNDMHVDRDGQPVANGLNLLSSVVQHSCYPNVMYNNVGRKLLVRSIGNIEKFSDVRVVYYNTVFGQPRSVRRAMLWKSHYFHCRCDECEMVNPGAREREAVRDRPFRCSACKKRGQKQGNCFDCAALGLGDPNTMEIHDEEMQNNLTEYVHCHIVNFEDHNYLGGCVFPKVGCWCFVDPKYF